MVLRYLQLYFKQLIRLNRFLIIFSFHVFFHLNYWVCEVPYQILIYATQMLTLYNIMHVNLTQNYIGTLSDDFIPLYIEKRLLTTDKGQGIPIYYAIIYYLYLYKLKTRSSTIYYRGRSEKSRGLYNCLESVLYNM